MHIRFFWAQSGPTLLVFPCLAGRVGFMLQALFSTFFSSHYFSLALTDRVPYIEAPNRFDFFGFSGCQNRTGSYRLRGKTLITRSILISPVAACRACRAAGLTPASPSTCATCACASTACQGAMAAAAAALLSVDQYLDQVAMPAIANHGDIRARHYFPFPGRSSSTTTRSWTRRLRTTGRLLLSAGSYRSAASSTSR
jgi:hypothetical protein